MDISIQVGEMIQIMVGELKGLIGELVSFHRGVVVMKCMSKELRGKRIEELPEHIDKYFEAGRRVKVIEGFNANTEGVITELSG